MSKTVEKSDAMPVRSCAISLTAILAQDRYANKDGQITGLIH